MLNKESNNLLLIYLCTYLKKNVFHNCWYSSTTSEQISARRVLETGMTIVLQEVLLFSNNSLSEITNRFQQKGSKR